MVNDDNMNDHPLKFETKGFEAENYLIANQKPIALLISEFINVASTPGPKAMLRLITSINHLNYYAVQWNLKSGKQHNADNCGDFSAAVVNLLSLEEGSKFTREGRENYSYCIATLYQIAEKLTAYPELTLELAVWLHLSNSLIMDFKIDEKSASLGSEISYLNPDLYPARKAEVISAYQQVKIKEFYHKLLAELWGLRDKVEDKKEQASFDKGVELILQQMAGIGLSEEQGNKPTWLRVSEALDSSSLNNYPGVSEVATQFKLQLVKLTTLSPQLPSETNINQEGLIENSRPIVKYWERFVNWIKAVFNSLFNEIIQEEAIELPTIARDKEIYQSTSFKRR